MKDGRESPVGTTPEVIVKFIRCNKCGSLTRYDALFRHPNFNLCKCRPGTEKYVIVHLKQAPDAIAKNTIKGPDGRRYYVENPKERSALTEAD